MRALDGATVLEPHDDPGCRPLAGRHPRPAQDLHPAAPEHVLDDRRGIGVVARQDVLARGDEDDLGTQPEVCLGELGAGDAGSDDDEPLGQLGELVDLLPGEDPLAVGHRGLHHPGSRPRRDEDDVGREVLGGAVLGRRPHEGRADERAHSRYGAHPDLVHPGGDVAALGGGEPEDPVVDLAEVDPGVGDGVALVVGEPHPEDARGAEVGQVVGRADEGLARHTVGEHRGPAEPVTVDDAHLGAEMGGDEGGLVATGASPEDDDGRGARVHGDHPTIRRAHRDRAAHRARAGTPDSITFRLRIPEPLPCGPPPPIASQRSGIDSRAGGTPPLPRQRIDPGGLNR